MIMKRPFTIPIPIANKEIKRIINSGVKRIFQLCGYSGLIVIGLYSLALQSCSTDAAKNTPEAKFTLSDSLYHTLEIDTVRECQVENSITLNGKITFNQDNVVQLFPMVSGKISDIRVMLGDYVRKGQVLAVIRSSEMAGYNSNLVNAQTGLEVAKKELDATSDMYKSGLSSQKDYLSAQAAYQQAVAELARIKEVIQINGGGAQGNYIVKTPIDGFVVEKNVTNNMDIRGDNATDLFTISDLKNIWVIANVYESNIADVNLGDSVNITTLSYPDKIFRGKVDKILNVLDPVNKVMKVRIVLPNPGYLLKPEMFASVTVTHPENQQMLCISSKALVFDNSQNYVLIFHSKDNIAVRPVTVAKSGAGKAYISSGLQEGDRVIASNELLIYQALKD